jgi:hypothetical protein
VACNVLPVAMCQSFESVMIDMNDASVPLAHPTTEDLSRTDPQKITPVSSRALARYLELEALLRNFFEQSGYCKEHFGRTCNGCCNENVAGHPECQGDRELDAERLRIYGVGNLTRSCPYSSDNGCVLETHKAPICIAYVCPQFTRALNEQGIEYDWFEIQTLLISVLNEAKFDWLCDSRVESYCISDEEFREIKKEFEISLKPRPQDSG